MQKFFIAFIVFILFVLGGCKSPQVAVSKEIDATAPVVVSEFLLPIDATTRETARGTVLVFSTNALFAYGSSDLPDSTYDIFSGAKFFLENNTNMSLVFETHTGNIGEANANYRLSVLRMKNGLEFMKTLEMDISRIEPIALGEALPEYEDQRKLRRYEFVVIRNASDRTNYYNFIKTLSTNKESDGKIITNSINK